MSTEERKLLALGGPCDFSREGGDDLAQGVEGTFFSDAFGEMGRTFKDCPKVTGKFLAAHTIQGGERNSSLGGGGHDP